MKRFRSRKSSPERGQGNPRRSLDSEPPSLPMTSWRWRKAKVAPEPKPEFNISSALPASEAFRTSLLMPNLSARFSMLREQDDPLSKLGKANDDSVLFPKRASRLELFKGHGLSEISEADFLRGSIRPRFASARTESYGSAGYDTDDGSVMSRSRPGEGNTMFGGRQKIYKIPVGGSGSVKKFGAKDDELPSGGNMGGKALYESDIATSTFQRLREEERQERERASVEEVRSSKEQDRDGSPPLAKYNRNRETSSSTNSGISLPRMSTAATSVASQRSIYYENMGSFSHALSSSGQPGSAGSDRPFPKASRRLYKQDLEQHMHEQQSSAIHRLESLNKQRSPAGGPASRNLQPSRSVTGLNDRYQRAGPSYAASGFRAGSPPPSGTPARMDEFDLGLGPDQAGNNLADSGYGRSPPLSPPMSPGDDPNNHDTTFLAALEPNDLGKATASRAFNKPKLPFDEQQYKERQIQLLEGRNTPSPQLIRPFSPQGIPIDSQTTSRSRNNSLGSTFSRTESVRQPSDHHREDRVLKAVPERGSRASSHAAEERQTNSNPAMEQSFLAERSSSDTAEKEPEDESTLSIPSSTSKYPRFFHPISHAKPNEPNQQLESELEVNHLTPPAEESASDSRSHLSESTITQPKDNNDASMIYADSPTLGPVGISNGLSGLVHAHLRNDSGQSSIYPEDYAASNSSPAEVRQSIFGHESALNHSRQGSKDDRAVNGEYWVKRRESGQSSIVAPPPLSFAARHILEQATAIRDNQQKSNSQQVLANEKAQRILGGEAPRSSHSRNPSATWQDQLRAHHARVGSTETQKEREGLANEMAERRRRVQDSLKTYVEDDSRSTSPAPFVRPQDDGFAKPRHPFGILKKPSIGSVNGKQERPSKAMKMLGIRPGETGNDASQSMPDMFTGRSQFHDRSPPLSKKPSPPRSPHDARQHPGNGPTFRPRLPNSGRSQETIAQRVSPPSSKSGSFYGDNAEKRPGSGKDNVPLPSLDWHRVNGSSLVTAAIGYEPRDLQSSPRPVDDMVDNMTRNGLPSPGRSQSAMSQRSPMSPTERSQSAMGGRYRSNSKPVSPSYFEPRTAPPGTPYMIKPKQFNRAPPPGTPFMINPKAPSRPPAARQNRHRAESGATSNESRPSSSSVTSSPSTMVPSQISPNYTYSRPEHPRKRSINKQDISEPTFISCTSSVDTVNLPPGASLSNGMEAVSPTRGPPPPIPVRNSRRKRTQTFLQSLARTERPAETTSPEPMPSSREDDPYEERSTFSADDEPSAKSKLRQRLRKTSSEGGLNAKAARQAALQAPSPAVPNFEVQSPGLEQHFPYQAQKDVPASAVMF